MTPGTGPRRRAGESAASRRARKAAKRGRARERAGYNRNLVKGVDFAGLGAAVARLAVFDETAAVSGPRRGPRAAPLAPEERWVPIGPSAVVRGQAIDRPRVSGRIVDVCADPNGQRAYAASAMGGVWYTGDGGATWSPFGGWSTQRRAKGGAVNGLSIGCLLVHFGDRQEDDVVLAGTGELEPSADATGAGQNGGIGVLASFTGAAATAQPWEPDTGLAQMEGLGIFRLARRPTLTPTIIGDATATEPDVVLAATSGGAYLGLRSRLPDQAAASGVPALAARQGYSWRKLALDWMTDNTITDAVWLTPTRVLLVQNDYGPAYCDVDFATPGDYTTLHFSVPKEIEKTTPAGKTITITGRMSLAPVSGDLSTVYLLGADTDKRDVPTLWCSTNATAAKPTLRQIAGTPVGLWGKDPKKSQRDYDQAIVAERVDVNGTPFDRVYLGGSAADFGAEWGASLYCFDVSKSATPRLIPAPKVSTTAAPASGNSGGAGAYLAGLIGNNVHADVHNIFLTGEAGPNRQVWVACDGGVFVSERAGQPLTFASCNTGIAALQPTFARTHPVNGHVIAAGFQDNGTQRRLGDTVWEEISVGDGGGVAWAPLAPSVLVFQYINAAWQGLPKSSFNDPISRTPGGTSDPASLAPDDKKSGFYSGNAAVRSKDGTVGRVAIGTYRIWISDDIKGKAQNTWKVLPWPITSRTGEASAVDDRRLSAGRPPASLGQVVTLAWATPTDLLALFEKGMVHYVNTAGVKWRATVWYVKDPTDASAPPPAPALTAPIATASVLTDIAPLPTEGIAHGAVGDFYLAATGVQDSDEETVWWHSNASGFHSTGFRHLLDPTPGTLGPRDPAFSVVVDPARGDTVYVGTATGVWRGVRTADNGTHVWTKLDNGLPEAMVQDLHIWWDGSADTPRLLRAGVQSRGLWELDIAAESNPGPARATTWIRAHKWDNRRMILATDVDPTVRVATPESLWASPDIVVRPRWPLAAPPPFIGKAPLGPGSKRAYDIWTFQTALRWRYPGVIADGLFSESLKAAVRFHRLGSDSRITKAVWDEIVSTRIDADGKPTTSGGDLAVYRAPWQTPRAKDVAPTEVDFLDRVVPPTAAGALWKTYREPSTVDVLIHHRDPATLAAGRAYAVLLWAELGAFPTPLTHPATGLVDYFRKVAAGTSLSPPTGWQVAPNANGDAQHTLDVPIDARLPRGVSIDVDLSADQVAAATTHILLLAFVNNDAEVTLRDPSLNTVTTVADLVSSWTYCAARVVELTARPT